jgi:tripartite-type tricarboxylate transporter receptor subunit TctC
MHRSPGKIREAPMKTRRFVHAALLATAAFVAGFGPAAAQDAYPTSTVKFVVPFAAGSATDTLARVLGEKMAASLGQSVVVDNMPGASGFLAAQNVARAEPDGHTVLITSNTTHAANQSLFKKLPYDPIADFAPVTKLGTITLALVVHPSVPAATAQELIAYAKANPEALTFGSGSSSSRIAGEMLKSLAGIEMVHVPYKSNPQAITDLLGGQISLVFADISTTLPQARAGKVKALAVSSPERTKLAPDLPTMVEAGVPGYDLTAWFAAFVPAGTPRPVIDKLGATFKAALADPKATETLLGAGIEPETSTPEELEAFVVAETGKWATIVKAAGIEPE